MKTVIIGRNGFLARALIKNCDQGAFTILGSSDFDLLTAIPSLLPSCQNADLLIDAADFYPGIEESYRQQENIYWTNVKIYKQIFSLAALNSIHRIITIGTTGCYPQINEPLSEDLFNGPPERLNPKLRGYALSRFTLLDIAALYKTKYEISHNHLILPNFYGPGDKYTIGRSHLLASWIRDFATATKKNHRTLTLWGPKTQQREFIFIQDAAKLILTLSKLDLPEEVLNVGTNTAPTFEELAKLLLSLLESTCEVEWDLEKSPNRQKEILNLQKLNKYQPYLPSPTPLSAGLKETVHDYLENYA